MIHHFRIRLVFTGCANFPYMQLSREQVELQSLIQYFYAIDGVPAKEVKLEKLRHSKIFIQSTSQGSRSLRKGDKVLYLKEVNNAIKFNSAYLHSYRVL